MILLSDTARSGTPESEHRISGEKFPWPGGGAVQAEIFILDETRNLERIRTERLPAHSWQLRVPANPPAVTWIRMRPAP